MSTNAQWALQKALLGALNADPATTAIFGNPLRVYDDVPEQPVFPFATFDRASVRPVNGDWPGALEHKMTLKVWSQYGGRREALDGLHALRAAINGASVPLDGHQLVNVRTSFADVFRVRSSRVFEAVLNLRAVTEILF